MASRHARRQPGRKVPWYLSRRAESNFQDLLARWEETTEGTEEALTLEEEIRSLPGFPRDYNPDRDIIVRVVTTLN